MKRDLINHSDVKLQGDAVKTESSFSATNVVQKLLQSFTTSSMEKQSSERLHDMLPVEADVSEDNLPIEIAELRQSLRQVSAAVGRYGSLMREIRYLLRV